MARLTEGLTFNDNGFPDTSICTRLSSCQFVPGQKVDVRGISKGKGFQGVMKRHNFKGQPASHGVSKTHRHAGSTGQCQDPGRVFKGKKMAGRMGVDKKTVQMLEVVKIDRGRELIYVKGQVPGNKGNWVEIRDAKKGNGLSESLVKTVNDQLDDKVYPEDKVPFPIFQKVFGVDGCGMPGHDVWKPRGEVDLLNAEYEEGN